MAYPNTYPVSYSYTGFSASLGDGSFPGTQLDADLAGLAAADTAVNLFLQNSFMSTGVLKPEALPGADPLTAYTQATANAAATAAAASATTASAASATAAAASAAGAATSTTTATNQASAASTSATNAAASATTAGTQATNAATSATAAAGSATTAAGLVGGLIVAQCRLNYVDANTIRLDQTNGNSITINGVAQLIPSPGPTLAATALTAGTTYYVYAYMVSTILTLEASTAAPAVGTNGQQIKTGDATRALVGMVNPITGPAFADTQTDRRVLSYYNRRPKSLRSGFTVSRTTTSTTDVEINSENRVRFLSWGDSDERFALNGYMTHSVTTSITYAGLQLDALGTTLVPVQVTGAGNAATSWDGVETAISAGLHTLLWSGRVGSAGTATYLTTCEIRGQIRG